ncbi:MAG TPA: M20/M25/M40 family metallo-hydrolase [Verrucomicrobiae bacterium]|jgi:carboxypeptidase Q|nr:M20/M25/M40 family metallo-hydrolase [Verrucomicrobiae bacterium]
MRVCRQLASSIAYLLFVVVLASSTSFAQEKVDLETISKIRYEGFRNSKIMDIATGLIEEIGPRVTGSPNVKRANEWTRDKLTEFGLVNSHLEPWGPFGRGWSNEYVNVRMTSPDVATLIAYPKVWTPGTSDVVHAQVVRVMVRLTPEDFAKDLEKYKGKLAGKIVLYGDDVDLKLPLDPPAARYSEKELAEIAQYPIPGGVPPQFRDFAARARLGRQLTKFFDDEKPLAVLDRSRGPLGGGTVFVQGVQGNPYKAGQKVGTPWLTLATEHFDRIAHILADKKDVELELNVKNTFYDADTQWDTIAEIPGTDKKDEVVMLGAHLDSWQAGTGATDNGAGTLVMMEAVRILKALDIKPRRTIRIGLWTGEEQGLLGSSWYVIHHYGNRPEYKDPERKGDPPVRSRENGPLTMTPEQTREQAKVSVYFNVDNGTGKIRGVYMQENAAVQPIFEAWMKPFADLGMNTLSMRNTGGTDHLSFDAVGIPGFQFIQDPMDYDSRTHHSNMDVFDRLQPDDLKQMAVIVASFVYMAAQRDQMFPRKPIEKPLPPPAPAQ